MPQQLTTEQILTLLAAAPPRIAATTDDLESELMHRKPKPDAWSVNDVLAHLRSCGDMWGSCIATILADDRPRIKAINPTTWINSTDYLEQDFLSSLHAYTVQRDELLTVLRPLPPEAWARAATVTVAGKPCERTVYFYAEWLARHERPHLKQIERTILTIRQS